MNLRTGVTYFSHTSWEIIEIRRVVSIRTTDHHLNHHLLIMVERSSMSSSTSLKMFFPQLSRPPGQFYFVTGLKLYIFGIHGSNHGKKYLICLPEGHWSNEKTVKTIVSMLHYCLQSHISPFHSVCVVKILRLHSDNCAGQNKNRYFLMYL